MGLLRFFKKSADKKKHDESVDLNAHYGQYPDSRQMQDYANADYRTQNPHFVRENHGGLSFFQQQRPSHNDPYFRGSSPQQSLHNAHHYQEGHAQGAPSQNYPLGSNHPQPYAQHQSPEQPHFQQRPPHPENAHQQHFHPGYPPQNGPTLAYFEKSPPLSQGYEPQKMYAQEPHFSAGATSHQNAPSHYSQGHSLGADQPSLNAAKNFSTQTSQTGGATVHAFDKGARQHSASGLSHKADYHGLSLGSQNLQQPVFTATAPALDRHPDVSSLFNASAANYSKSTNNTDLKELRFWDNGEVSEEVTQPLDDEETEPQPLRFILALGILIIFAALAWLVFRWSTQSVSTTIPHIQADAEPYKMRPDNPGGLIVPHQDKLVYGRIGTEGNAGMDQNNAPVERLLPPPEQPMMQPNAQYPSNHMGSVGYPQDSYNQQAQGYPQNQGYPQQHSPNQGQGAQQGAYPQNGNAMDNGQFPAPQNYPTQGQMTPVQGANMDQSYYPATQQGQHYPNGEGAYPQQAGAPMQQGGYGPQGAPQGYNPNYPQQAGYPNPQNGQHVNANEGNGPYYPDTIPDQNAQARPVSVTQQPQNNAPQQGQNQNVMMPTMPSNASTTPGSQEVSGTATPKKPQAVKTSSQEHNSQMQNQPLVSSGPGELPTGFLGSIPKNATSQGSNDVVGSVPFFKARIASLETKAAAEKEWSRLRSKHADLFKSLNKSIVKETVNGKSMYVVQALGLQGEEAAKQFCKKVGNQCTYHKQ